MTDTCHEAPEPDTAAEGPGGEAAHHARLMGQRMVASYRAARLANRAGLRDGLRATRASLRAERQARLCPGSESPPPAAEMVQPPASAGPRTSAADSVFALYLATEKGLACADRGGPDTPPSGADAANPASERFSEAVGRDGAQAGQAAGNSAPHGASPHAEPSAIPFTGPGLDSPPGPPPAPQAEASPGGPDLATLGFGQAMRSRLSQIGIASVIDLADADMEFLRQGLGDVGDLVNIGLWIERAKSRVRDVA